LPYSDPDVQREFQRKRLAQTRANYFADKCCVKCGAVENLEIHHKDRSTKVSHRFWSWRAERRDEELRKCEVRCHDCHVKQHSQDGTWVPPEPERKWKEWHVRLIRAFSADGLSARKISKKLGVPRQTVDDMLDKTTWAWLN
jgi:hypothetical protein